MEEFTGKLSPELEAIREVLLNGKTLHVDETPLRTTEKPEYDESGGQNRLKTSKNATQSAYLRVYSNEEPPRDKIPIDANEIMVVELFSK